MFRKSDFQKLFFKKKVILLFNIFILILGCKEDNDSIINLSNGRTTAIFNPNLSYSSMTDQQGNIYQTITIDGRVWMAENLRTTLFNDGTKIPKVTDNEEWANQLTPAYCIYNNSENIDSIATYGCLYNWFAVGTGKLAPLGWHVATDEDWWSLIKFLGDRPYSGGFLKETGIQHWNDPNNYATNISGFTALPSGCRYVNGQFYSKGLAFKCWRAEPYLDKYGICWYLSNNNIFSAWAYYLKQTGFSVRCVKD